MLSTIFEAVTNTVGIDIPAIISGRTEGAS